MVLLKLVFVATATGTGTVVGTWLAPILEWTVIAAGLTGTAIGFLVGVAIVSGLILRLCEIVADVVAIFD